MSAGSLRRSDRTDEHQVVTDVVTDVDEVPDVQAHYFYQDHMQQLKDAGVPGPSRSLDMPNRHLPPF